jgi:hypothetical protein
MTLPPPRNEFESMFQATYQRALDADRRPVAVAIGAYGRSWYLYYLQQHNHTAAIVSAQSGKYPPYNGLPVRAMTAPGIAIITAPPHPESGFDVV